MSRSLFVALAFSVALMRGGDAWTLSVEVQVSLDQGRWEVVNRSLANLQACLLLSAFLHSKAGIFAVGATIIVASMNTLW